MEPNDDLDDYSSKLDEGTYKKWKEESKIEVSIS